MEFLSACPACNSSRFDPYLTCVDHTVSHETFHLQKCTSCGFVLTNPRPLQTELPRYYQSENYISHSENKSGLLNQTYDIARRFTMAWKLKIVQKHSVIRPTKVLDYGCGTGAFLRKCLDEKINATGIEPSSEARSIAIKNTNAPVYADMAGLNGTYDVITLWHVLEHVPDLHQTLQELKDHLEINGTMFIAVPNLQSPDAKKYKENWAGYDVPRHLWHFSKDTMKRILDKHLLKIHTVIPMKLDAYYVSLLSEKYRGQSNTALNITKALIAGWNANRKASNSLNHSSLIYIIRK